MAFGKPVVYVHGDSHLFRVDESLVVSRSLRIIENFTRVEIFGCPYSPWLVFGGLDDHALAPLPVHGHHHRALEPQVAHAAGLA